MANFIACYAQGCPNKMTVLLTWQSLICPTHGALHGQPPCTCQPPFRFYTFPGEGTHDRADRRKWLEIFDRIDPYDHLRYFKPASNHRVCSEHFVDGRPTEKHPLPELKLRKDTDPRHRPFEGFEREPDPVRCTTNHCYVTSCPNSRRNLKKWNNTPCEEHGVLHGDETCDCPPPCQLYFFPGSKFPEERLRWMQIINRADPEHPDQMQVPLKHLGVCSHHFVDKKPTARHPHPTLNILPAPIDFRVVKSLRRSVQYYCYARGCPNGSYGLNTYSPVWCVTHDVFHGSDTCDCETPFQMFPFPNKSKFAEVRHRWLKNMDRKDPDELKDVLGKFQFCGVCSEHFMSGRPTEENPDPVLKLLPNPRVVLRRVDETNTPILLSIFHAKNTFQNANQHEIDMSTDSENEGEIMEIEALRDDEQVDEPSLADYKDKHGFRATVAALKFIVFILLLVIRRLRKEVAGLKQQNAVLRSKMRKTRASQKGKRAELDLPCLLVDSYEPVKAKKHHKYAHHYESKMNPRKSHRERKLSQKFTDFFVLEDDK